MSEEEYIKRIIEDYLIDCEEEVFWRRDRTKDNKYGFGEKGPLRAFVNCNDWLYWAAADCEVIEPEDIDELIEFSKRGEENKTYFGDLVWVSKKRNKRPQRPQWDYKGKVNQTLKNWIDEVVPLTDETKGYME